MGKETLDYHVGESDVEQSTGEEAMGLCCLPWACMKLSPLHIMEVLGYRLCGFWTDAPPSHSLKPPPDHCATSTQDIAPKMEVH